MIRIITATIKTKNLVNVFCKITKIFNTINILCSTQITHYHPWRIRKCIINVAIDRSIKIDHSIHATTCSWIKVCSVASKQSGTTSAYAFTLVLQDNKNDCFAVSSLIFLFAPNRLCAILQLIGLCIRILLRRFKLTATHCAADLGYKCH